ncbi:IPT/TIG domain-containing protein [Dactylosporangium cerinum]|uniref:IPT/TIG domain-containing protein n=1 Tax=Dactylosporangium cerinum TaxID=1434730 RepID=A0ABV9WEQ8_9ACTN
MSHVHSWRHSRLARAVSIGAAAATLLVVVQPLPAHAATLPGTLALTSPANGKLAALTKNQVVTLTVSGTGATALSEDNVVAVKLGADPNCDDLTNYVVTSATTITVKTPSTGCIASSAAEEVAILFNDIASPDTIAKASAITFVSPPKLGLLATKPVINDNSSAISDVTKQAQRFLTSGAQVVRVKAAADFAFDPRTTAGLKANLGGKDGTDVKVYDATTGLTQRTAATATDQTVTADVGNYLTFKTAAGMDANNDTIIITQNGVSKSFLKADTGADVVVGPAITSMNVTSGKATGGTVVAITGTNFNKTLSAYANDGSNTVKVMFCGIEADNYGVTSPATPAVNSGGTVITVITPNVTADALGVGATNYAGVCPVSIQEGSWVSPLNGATSFAFLNE